MHNGIRIGEEEFHDFDSAVLYAEQTYGYEGWAWDDIVLEREWEQLHEFLENDSVEAELLEEE